MVESVREDVVLGEVAMVVEEDGIKVGLAINVAVTHFVEVTQSVELAIEVAATHSVEVTHCVELAVEVEVTTNVAMTTDVEGTTKIELGCSPC